MSSITDRISAILAAAREVEAAAPETKIVGLSLPADPQRVVRGIIHTAARDAAWEEAAVHIFQALPIDGIVSLSFIHSNVPENDWIEYPQDLDPGLYAAQRAADATTFLRSQPKGTHKRFALSLASDAGVEFATKD